MNIKRLLKKQELYKTYWYFHFRNSKKPNLKKLRQALGLAAKIKLENHQWINLKINIKTSI